MEISLFGAPNHEIREYDNKQTILDRYIGFMTYELLHPISMYHSHRMNAIALKMSAAERDIPEWAGAWEIGNLQNYFQNFKSHNDSHLFQFQSTGHLYQHLEFPCLRFKQRLIVLLLRGNLNCILCRHSSCLGV